MTIHTYTHTYTIKNCILLIGLISRYDFPPPNSHHIAMRAVFITYCMYVPCDDYNKTYSTVQYWYVDLAIYSAVLGLLQPVPTLLIRFGCVGSDDFSYKPLLIFKRRAMLLMCVISTFSRVWINRRWLPILLGLAEQGNLIYPCPRSPLRTWSRETGSAVVPRQPILSPHSG